MWIIYHISILEVDIQLFGQMGASQNLCGTWLAIKK
jgi:hypothetical protein